MDWAKGWLEAWDFVSNVVKAHEHIVQLKNVLKKEHKTKFRGFDDDETGEIYNEEVTDELREYVARITNKASLFLSA